MKDDKLYIDQILDAIRKIESYVSGFGEEKFLEDEKTQSAVILQLTIIGEVSKKVSDETKNKLKIPWKKIAGFRDRAMHNYFEMNLSVVWDTIQLDIPELKQEIKKGLQ